MIAESSNATRKAPDFDGLAPVYRWMEWLSFGPFLGWCRCAFLQEMLGAKRALVFGDGDGRFTAQLLRNNQAVRIDAVDSSRAMLSALEYRAALTASRLQTHCIDARDWHDEIVRYDLIVTHFFLDCLTTPEVRALAQRVRAAAVPDAMWVVSEFAIPENWFGKLVAQPIVRMLYAAFGSLTGLAVRQLPNYPDALRRNGFRLMQKRALLAGLLVSELWVLESDA